MVIFWQMAFFVIKRKLLVDNWWLECSPKDPGLPWPWEGRPGASACPPPGTPPSLSPTHIRYNDRSSNPPQHSLRRNRPVRIWCDPQSGTELCSSPRLWWSRPLSGLGSLRTRRRWLPGGGEVRDVLGKMGNVVEWLMLRMMIRIKWSWRFWMKMEEDEGAPCLRWEAKIHGQKSPSFCLEVKPYQTMMVVLILTRFS